MDSNTFDMIGSTEIGQKSVRFLAPSPALALGMGVILAAFNSVGICEVCRLRLNRSHRLLAMAGAVSLRMLARMSSTPEAFVPWSLDNKARTSSSAIILSWKEQSSLWKVGGHKTPVIRIALARYLLNSLATFKPSPTLICELSLPSSLFICFHTFDNLVELATSDSKYFHLANLSAAVTLLLMNL